MKAFIAIYRAIVFLLLPILYPLLSWLDRRSRMRPSKSEQGMLVVYTSVALVTDVVLLFIFGMLYFLWHLSI